MPQPTHLPDVWAHARALRDKGDLASARMLLEDSLDVATFQYGEDHPDILVTSHILATLYRRAGDLPAARRLLEEALQAGSARLAESDPVILRLSFELAGVVDALGNRHEARRHYTRVAQFGGGVEGLEDQVRESVAWLGPAPPHSPAPGVVAVTPDGLPDLPQRVPQYRPVMAGSPPPAPPAPPMPQQAAPPPAETTAPVSGPPVSGPPVSAPPAHAPLPSLSGPVRFKERPHEPDSEPIYRPALAQTPDPARDADLTQRGDAAQRTGAPAPAPVFTTPPSVIVERRGRGAVFLATAAAVVAVLAAVFVVMLILGRPGGPAGTPALSSSQDATPAPSRGPATGLTLSDHGGSVTLRWADPADAQAGFAVKMGATKDSLTLVTGNLGSKSAFTITGLNARYNYCFSVVTIYSGTELRDSEVVCTARTSAKPSRTR